MKKSVGVLVAIGLLLLAACASSKPANKMVGLWRRESQYDNQFWRFDEDGTYLIADTVDNLDDAPWLEGEYWLEGDRLFLKDTAAGLNTWTRCVGITTTYEIEWPSEKRFDLGAVHDPCWQRNNYFSEETFVSWKE
jgi:hypothetical protein